MYDVYIENNIEKEIQEWVNDLKRDGVHGSADACQCSRGEAVL